MAKSDHILSFGVNSELYDRLESIIAEDEELTKSQICREGLREELQYYENE